MNRKQKKVVGVIGRMKQRKVVKKRRKELILFQVKTQKLQSEKICDTPSWGAFS